MKNIIFYILSPLKNWNGKNVNLMKNENLPIRDNSDNLKIDSSLMDTNYFKSKS